MNRTPVIRRLGAGALALSTTIATMTVAPLATVAVAQTAHNLLITEYVEGTSFNKALEITNIGNAPVDLADYAVHVFSNGNTSPSSDDRLGGTLQPGGSFVYGSNRAVFEVDQATGAGLWNGNDAIVLYAGDEVVDSFGRVGEDPGAAWEIDGVSTVDATLRRMPDSVPDTDPFDEFDPAAEWLASPVDTFDDLGRWGDDDEDDDHPQEPIGSCGDDAMSIGDVQGTGDASPIEGDTAEVEGVVIGTFQEGGFDGYYLQDEGDGDEATSDGIFIYSTSPAVEVGDRVRVSGEVVEYFEQTQITPDHAEICESGQDLPAPTELSLPIEDRGDLESLEGMRVTLPQEVTIIEAFNYDRYGQIVVSSDRQFQPTNIHEPGSAEAAALAEANAADRIMIDDGRSSQNPDPAIHPDGEEFTIDHRFRMGDRLDGVTGVLDYRFDEWAIQPTQGATHTAANSRPEAHGVSARLTVGQLNVLNYFTTLRSEDSDARGALDAEELRRQQDKLVAALIEMDSDVVGLMEIENNGEAVNTLVEALNDELGEGTYEVVQTGELGPDAITQALIYKPEAVTPAREHRVLDETVDPRFVTSKSRPALGQVFTDNSTGEDVAVVVNHLKSKGSGCEDLGDPEDPDGQGNCNGVRTNAARAMVDWLAGDEVLSQTEKTLIIGDLNSYAMEDPIAALTEAGYVDTLRSYHGDESYTYVFDGQLGHLDHALASPSLDPFVVDASAWSINADEPDLLDYTTEFKQPAQQEIYAPDAYRSSDHDPVIVGLDLTGAGGGSPVPGSSGGSVSLGSLDVFGSLGGLVS